MGEFLKIGGKYVDSENNELSKGITVNESGILLINRKNEMKLVDIIYNVEKRDGNNIGFTDDKAIDLSEWTTYSILVANTLDVNDARIRLYAQRYNTGTAYLRTYSDISTPGNAFIPLPSVDSGGYLITPEDFPLLNYLHYFKGRFEFPTVPTSGSISVSLLLKR